ncbi:MAG: 1-deoxy-D-xylulose-5-phosphate reductoisomerase, partial [Sedimentisphaerales bacterium]|nr:1-deoxy-D-xylulose-5-phosphate reductoisomerase [Sedimentisphaerales bacterium]
EHLSDRFEVISVSGHSRWQDIARQARQFNLEKVVITDQQYAQVLKEELKDTRTRVITGAEGMVELATDPDCDIVIASIVGAAGLPAVLAAVEAGKTVAIANKEALVVAGCILMPLAKKTGATILPIDSEHSAILQSMHSGNHSEVEKIIVTASGGPFRKSSLEQIKNATLEDALNHPTWNMGPKITIDSATMMNKALEVIEARWLFDMPAEKIEVLVHPESIIHSMVEFCDGSVIAQMSPPDMKLPIQYALTYPERLPCPTKKLKLHQLGSLTFYAPDMEKFPAVRLGFEVASRGGTCGAVLNAANEAAVNLFRQRKIGFTDIARITEMALKEHNFCQNPDLSELMTADSMARNFVAANYNALS